MKIVIIGGGIAGLALSILMKRKGHDVLINEKNDQIPLGVNAFMMNNEGKSVVQKIFNDSNISLPGSQISRFVLRRPDGEEMVNQSMETWQCVRRMDLVNALLSFIDPGTIKYRRSFSHFLYSGNKAVAAVFENGDIEYGDIFVGADGCHSLVRQNLFGKTSFSPVEVKEILGTIKNKQLIDKLKGVFTKYQHAEKGLSFGFIPFSESELIWYSQFDVKLAESMHSNLDDLRSFTKELLKDFPEIVNDIIDETDFAGSYLWNTKDFDPLNTYHKENVVVIGDAAHVALPFTSAGTSDALFDAECLSDAIENESSIENAFTLFYNKRIESIKAHLRKGRMLKEAFLNPMLHAGRSIEIPLINQKTITKSIKIQKPTIEVMYFTDPICSTCWSMQPSFRKFQMNYKNDIDFTYVMGGLLPSWNNFERGAIKKPSDVYQHWQEESIQSGMPIDGRLWLDYPIQSSYPPSIAFKAAQLQDEIKADYFFRRLKEKVFVENINITDIETIKQAADDVGLNKNQLLADIENNALNDFKQDLHYTNEYNINIFPTIIFKVNGEEKDCLTGFQSYETLEQLLIKYSDTDSRSVPVTPLELFEDYKTLTLKEFSYLSNSDAYQANLMIRNLLQLGSIKERKSSVASIFYSC